MSGRYRLAEGGLIDRGRPVGFRFDGRSLRGFQGDTLASALLANGVLVTGRSFKYHRPRGVFSAGVEEPAAIVTVGEGAQAIPNTRATQVPLSEGLVARSQNCWPSAAFDLGSIAGLFSPLLPAGFYYKTFMALAGGWRFYERFIRRAAGLGRVPQAEDSARYESVHAACDVLVVGGGPAGLGAALAAARAGARVILAEQQDRFGGDLLSGGPVIDGMAAAEWTKRQISELASLPDVTLLTRATVSGYYDHNFLTIAERCGENPANDGPVRERLWKVRARQVVLAAGAIERPLFFENNDLPGIMLAGALRSYLARFAVCPGEKAVVATTNDSAYRTALALLAAGRSVTVIDMRTEPDGPPVRTARERGAEVIAGHAVIAAQGRSSLRSLEIVPLGDGAGKTRRIAADLLAVSGGWTPTVHLFSQSRGRLRFDERIGALLPGEAAQAVICAGACNGAFRLKACLEEGTAAGAQAARQAGFGDTKAAAAPDVEEPAEVPALPVPPGFIQRLLERRSGGAKVFVDLQNDVTLRDIRIARDENFGAVEHLKRYTTLGMGTDQGKTSSIPALAALDALTPAPAASLGHTTYRPPYTPVTLGAIAGSDRGALLEPVRHVPAHDWHRARGAVFASYGQWRRARYYPRDGEDMAAAVNREVRTARETAALFDASSLGKIEVQGPDAAAFLDLIYTSRMSALRPGRCRYGVMLKEDGMVFDDGVVTRLGEDHFHLTTTTGNAAAVYGWLEEWLQTEWTHLRVFCTPVTEQWAAISLSGPKTRAILQPLTDIALDADAFPLMAYREGEVAGLPARLFSVSFTGESGFEIYVPSGGALALIEKLRAAGPGHGLVPIGTEAIHVLRAEKGFIVVGQETDGTVTPLDLGLERMVAADKPDFLGKRSLARPAMRDPARKQLVGLLTEDPATVLQEGGQIVEGERFAPPMTSLGHVTSSYFSPNLGRSIALALLSGGRARHGERLGVPDLQGQFHRVKVVPPVFLKGPAS